MQMEHRVVSVSPGLMCRLYKLATTIIHTGNTICTWRRCLLLLRCYRSKLGTSWKFSRCNNARDTTQSQRSALKLPLLMSECCSFGGCTLYTPLLPILIMEPGFLDFVQQSAAWVALSTQSPRSPSTGYRSNVLSLSSITIDCVKHSARSIWSRLF